MHLQCGRFSGARICVLSKNMVERRRRSMLRLMHAESMKAFVTGATGFVGSHVAQALAAQGADLRLLVRASSKTDNIADLQAERVVGDLRDAASLKSAMQGCDFVFHVAADYRLWVRDPEQMYRSNVEGTRAIIEAAQQSGVRRVIYTSSVATMGFTTTGHPRGRIFAGFSG